MHSAKDCIDLVLYIHPQGHYVAAMNKYVLKKAPKYKVEIFETKVYGSNSIPHLEILINREVHEFHNVIFEPFQGKLAVHTTFRKELKSGEKQFSNDPNRLGVDVYQLKSDTLLGLTIKTVGLIASDKIKEIYFSCVGNVFCTVESEGASRNSLNFYMIARIS